MLYQSITAAALSLLACVNAAPVNLPASSDLQNSIIALEANIVSLINDYVQSNAANAVSDYNNAQAKFVTLGQAVSSPTGYNCPSPPSTGAQIETQDAAVAALNTAQTDLMQLSLDLMNVNSSPDTLNNDFCEAYGNFQSVDYYTFNKVGA